MKKFSRLIQDNDGHWYLIPDSKIARFEELIQTFDYLDESEYDSHAAKKIMADLQKFQEYSIDNPSNVLIKDWEV